MGSVCGTRARHSELQRVFEGSLFLQLLGGEHMQTILQEAQVRQVDGEHPHFTIPGKTGQLVVVFEGYASLFASGVTVQGIRAHMPMPGHWTSHASYEPDLNVGEKGIVQTAEAFLFWKTDTELVCRYTSDSEGEEVILHSTLCDRVELKPHSRYLLLPPNNLPLSSENKKESSLNALTNADFIAMLAAIPFFAGLPTVKLSALTEMSTIRVYPPKSVIFREDEGFNTQMFVTLAGAVEVTSSKSTGPLAKLEAGSFFGEMSLLINIPRAATVTTLESCMVMSIDKKHFHALLDQSPELREGVNKILKERLLSKALMSGVLPFFDSVPRERMIRFSHAMDIEDHIRKGDVVMRQDSDSPRFALLVYGALEITSKHKESHGGGMNQDNSVFLTPGCSMGPFTFERVNIKKGKIIACSAAVVMSCSFDKLQQLFEEFPNAGAAANIAWFGERCDLASVLRHELLTQRFQAFLEAEHSDENFFFCQDVLKFRATTDAKKRLETAEHIQKRYIQPEAVKEVNLPAIIRDNTLERLSALDPTQGVETTFFDEAFEEIMRLMVKDSFPRFKKSMNFQNVVDMLDPHTTRKGSRLAAACHHFRDSLHVLRPGHLGNMQSAQMNRMMSTIQKSQASRHQSRHLSTLGATNS